MTDQKQISTHSPSLNILRKKRKTERSPSVDSYIMTSQEERRKSAAMINAGFVYNQSDNELSRSDESEFSTSAVRVDIEDYSDLSSSNCANITTHSLRKCKTHILIPYSRLLKLIGWKPFGKDSLGNGCGWKFINTVYVILILLLVIYTYVYDIIACQWKLDIKTDTQSEQTTLRPPPTTQIHNHTLPPYNPNTTAKHVEIYLINGTSIEIFPPGPLPSPDDGSDLPINRTEACGHIATTYIIPDLLHLAAYILGLWYFRLKENEQLYALMEKVFLQTANMQTRTISQNKLIGKLRWFFILGAFWVLLTIGLQGLFVYTFGMQRENILTSIYSTQEKSVILIWLWSLFAIDLLGVATANMINLAVVLNYGIQCEMLRYYINTIGTRWKERSTNLKTSMKDILSVRESISLLNSSIARMTSLAVIRFAEMFVIGLCILILNQDDQWKIWLYRALFPIIWGMILVFPLTQAAKLNAACAKLKAVALNIRVYGYQNCSEEELDSFLAFIANTTLRSKLFHIPVKPSYLLGSLIIICFTLLLLFQTSYVGPAGRLF